MANGDFNMTWSNVTPAPIFEVNQETVGMMKYLSFLYVLGIIFGSLGNILVFLLVCFCGDMKKPMYLLIGNLAIADWLVTFICLPLFTVHYVFFWPEYPYPQWLCKALAYLIHGSALSSVFTLLAITYNRFFAICYPFQHSLQLNRRKTYWVILLIWFLSLGSTLPSPLVHGIREITLQGENVELCKEVWSTKTAQNGYLLFRIILFVVFVFQILLLYFLIGRKIVQSKIPGQKSISSQHNDKIRSKSNRKVIKMMLVVCTFFILCWSPYMVSKFLIIVSPSGYKVPDLFLAAANLLAMMNSVLNPYLYLITQKFRTGLKRILTCHSVKNLQNSVSTLRPRKSSTASSKSDAVQLQVNDKSMKKNKV